MESDDDDDGRCYMKERSVSRSDQAGIINTKLFAGNVISPGRRLSRRADPIRSGSTMITARVAIRLCPARGLCPTDPRVDSRPLPYQWQS